MKEHCMKMQTNKRQKMGRRVVPSAAGCECCSQWSRWISRKGEKSIPRDVPKGHLAVYVGDDCKRHVIKITLFKHPLFKALLDQVQNEYIYDFTAGSKLCIPCDENIFLNVVQHASSPWHQRSCWCI
ncbi:hypothetical protein NMG60_11000589 [Bertholletia excelsa]